MLMTIPIDDLSAAIRNPATWWASTDHAIIAVLATRPVACPSCGQTRLLYAMDQAPDPGYVKVGCLSDCARFSQNS